MPRISPRPGALVGDPGPMSVALVYGNAVSAPVFRDVGGVATFEIDVRSKSLTGASASVSVVMSGELPVVMPDDTVLVIGTARRRFFRAGGATVSRTEIDAVEILVNPDARKRKRAVGSALEKVAAVLAA
jgi:hypothetical protein